MPQADQIWKAYSTYYTHAAARIPSQPGPLKRTLAFIKRGYWARNFGYDNGATPLSRRLGQLLYLSPIHRRESEAEIRFLNSIRDGRLLDVGCGSGDWLLEMRDRGWAVEGLDFDDKAIAAAKLRGISIRKGSLEEQNYANNTFDAVTLSHVIEHVPDPVATMRECLRILKPGGQVILLTPNSDSLSHHIFKTCWRGLEPPRHLHIFSLRSIDLLLTNVGFAQRSVRPFIVTSVIYDSLQIWRNRGAFRRRSASHWAAWLVARAFKLIELFVICWRPSAGDCVVAVARKAEVPEPRP